MGSRKIQVTSKQVDRLLADVRAIPNDAAGEHLTDDQFIFYTLSQLSAEATTTIEQHLSQCAECAAEMEHLLEASESWTTDKPQNVLPFLATSLQKVLTTTDQPRDEHAMAWAAEANDDAVKDVWRDAESGIDGHGFLDANGDLIIVFISKRIELQDRRLVFRISFDEAEVEQEETLAANESGTEVAATFVIPRYQLGEGKPQVSLTLKDTDT